MDNLTSSGWRQALLQGFVAGLITVSASTIGMVELFGTRYFLAGLFTMGQLLLFAPPAVLAFSLAGKIKSQGISIVTVKAAAIGAISGAMLALLVWANQTFPLRTVLINLSPKLMGLLTFDRSLAEGALILIGVSVATAVFGALLQFVPRLYRQALLSAIITTLGVGLLAPLLFERIRNFFGQSVAQLVFTSSALQVVPAIIIFAASAALFYFRGKAALNSKPKAEQKLNPRQKMLRQIPLAIFLLILPMLLGSYLTEITNNVGIFLLMGLGLNIVVGLAGLLDLGYVAFFAIGAYTMAVLTSTGPLGVAQMSFWAALPICVAVSALAGVLLGTPVLRMRGDYLAIVTLGFGEIIRILALSDLLKPFIGGAQGILQIPKPSIAGITLISPEQLYYVILGGALLAAFISNRLRESRVGRTWIAMREDEDVAEAMGINLVRTKLLAFAIGAGFSGLAGAIFSPKLTSIFPHSFNLLISINILSLIIVGGLGSIPGTIVGALVLVGLPELLREFAEFRWLMYGLLLVVMMLNRPEGFIPSDVIRRELHSGDEHRAEV
ncbi:MAG: hypothetical protein KIS80_02750 [Anaerolineales bacterium]|nr:hypothetical protein [Anaerolineales bacterium]